MIMGAAFALAALVTPSLAQEGAKPADITKGREIFDNYACGSCHALSDAGAAAHVGPGLDGNPNLSIAFITERVSKGEGAMPAFGDQLTGEEIADLAAYVMQASRK